MTFAEAIGCLEHAGMPAGSVRLQVSLIAPDSPTRLKSQVLEAYLRLRSAHDLTQVARLGRGATTEPAWVAALDRVRREVRAAIETLDLDGLSWEALLGPDQAEAALVRGP